MSSWADLYADDPNTAQAYQELAGRTIGDHAHPTPSPFTRDPSSETPPPRANLTKGDPNGDFLPGVPTWEAPPQSFMGHMTGDQQVGFFNDALENRYGSTKLMNAGNAFAGDIGLGGNVHVAQQSNSQMSFPEGDHMVPALGATMRPGPTHPGYYVIDLNRDMPPEYKTPTYLHELSHVADHEEDPGFVTQPEIPGNPQSRHHAHFSEVETELPYLMEVQRAIEHGMPVNRAALDSYPKLQDVKPLSSNRLASPWGF